MKTCAWRRTWWKRRRRKTAFLAGRISPQPHVRRRLHDLASGTLRDTFLEMSTITAILEPDADGTLHLPVPQELRCGKVRITATMEAAAGASPRAKGGVWSGRPGFWMAADFDAPVEDFREYME